MQVGVGSRRNGHMCSPTCVYLAKIKKVFWKEKGKFSLASIPWSHQVFITDKHSQTTSLSWGKISVNWVLYVTKHSFKSEGKMKKTKQNKTTVRKRLGEFTNPWCFIKEINVIQQKEKWTQREGMNYKKYNRNFKKWNLTIDGASPNTNKIKAQCNSKICCKVQGCINHY